MGDQEGPTLRPPRRERVVDDVRRSLEEAILTGQMRPGDRLREKWLSEQLQVSRTTVREALLMLREHGLVETRPRHGTFVAKVSATDAFDLRITRALLEGFAVRLRTEAFDREVGAELEGIIAAMGESTLPRGIPRLIDLDIAFHRAVMLRARSSVLMEMWAGTNGLMRAVFLGVMSKGDVSVEEVVAVHREVLAELRSGDADRAQRAIATHYVRRHPPPEGSEVAVRVAALLRLTDG